MKIVVNKCFGGFGLSPKAIKRISQLQRKECYFFKDGLKNDYKEITLKQAEGDIFFSAFSVPNPNEYLQEGDWRAMTIEERQAQNARFDAISLRSRYDYEERTNPLLIQVVEELGEKAASGKLALLKIIEIPDGIEWEIDDYDGVETIREQHRSW